MRATVIQVWDKEQRAFVPGTPGMPGSYSAMDQGEDLAVRELIEEHRDKMLTIRRRDFEVVNLLIQPGPLTFSVIRT